MYLGLYINIQKLLLSKSTTLDRVVAYALDCDPTMDSNLLIFEEALVLPLPLCSLVIQIMVEIITGMTMAKEITNHLISSLMAFSEHIELLTISWKNNVWPSFEPSFSPRMHVTLRISTIRLKFVHQSFWNLHPSHLKRFLDRANFVTLLDGCNPAKKSRDKRPDWVRFTNRNCDVIPVIVEVIRYYLHM